MYPIVRAFYFGLHRGCMKTYWHKIVLQFSTITRWFSDECHYEWVAFIFSHHHGIWRGVPLSRHITRRSSITMFSMAIETTRTYYLVPFSIPRFDLTEDFHHYNDIGIQGTSLLIYLMRKNPCRWLMDANRYLLLHVVKYLNVLLVGNRVIS